MSSLFYLIMVLFDVVRKYVVIYIVVDVEVFWKMCVRWIKWLMKNKFDVILLDDLFKIIVCKIGYMGYEL